MCEKYVIPSETPTSPTTPIFSLSRDPSRSRFFPHLLGALEEAASHQSRQDQGTDDGNGQTAEVFDVGDDAHQEDDGLQTFTQSSGEGQDEEGVFLAEAHLPAHRRATKNATLHNHAQRENFLSGC